MFGLSGCRRCAASARRRPLEHPTPNFGPPVIHASLGVHTGKKQWYFVEPVNTDGPLRLYPKMSMRSRETVVHGMD